MRELDPQLIIAKLAKLTDEKLLNPVINETEEMQAILVSSIKKVKG